MFAPNRLKARLVARDPVYGAWISSANATNAEILAHAGYDFLVLDQEHGPGALTDAIAMMRACDAAGCQAIIRVPWNDQVYLKRILDSGAQSIMVPMVETPEEAAAAVSASRYPPAGRRGYAAGAMRCSNYGFVADYMARAADELCIVVQLESAAAAKAAKAIGSVDGVDCVFIGVNDMAGSIGRLERLDDPEVRELVAIAEAGIRAAGKPIGSVPQGSRSSVDLFKAGYTMVAGAGDVVLLRQAAKADLEAVRAGSGGAKPY